jgi:hypothetical protein
MATVAGGEANDGWELAREMSAPPGGAAMFNITWFVVDGTPPSTVAGERVRLKISIGTKESEAVWELPPAEAEIVTRVGAETAVVVMVNCAEELSCGMVTEAGTWAAPGLELDRVTTSPPGPAGDEMATRLLVET